MAVYMLKFDRPAGDPEKDRASARYYIGYANDHTLPNRIAEHRAGRSGARLCEWFHEEGIGFRVVRIWWGASRAFERRLKNNGHFYKHDPRCEEGRSRLRRAVHVLPREEELIPIQLERKSEQ